MSQQDRLNDELLVLRCQEGDAEAFELLVGRWQRRLWRHAWRLTGDESTAWDAVQETWVGISRGISRLVDPAVFSAWAYRIVTPIAPGRTANIKIAATRGACPSCG